MIMHHYVKLQKEYFDPEDIAVLVGAFQKACKHRGIVDDSVRELLAKHIIEKATSGELGRDKLCQDAMDRWAVALLTLHQSAGQSTQAGA